MLTIFIPALLFASGFHVNFHLFRNILLQALLMAGPGVVVAFMLTGGMAKYMLHVDWSWSVCFMYGAMVSATDPVAVVSLLHELGAPETLGTVIEGESLLNDGTAYVFFLLFKSVVEGTEWDWGESMKTLAQMSLGGAAVGLAFYQATTLVLKHNFYRGDKMIEQVLLIVIPYLVFYTAEVPCEMSGVLAVVVFSIMLSRSAHYHIIDYEAINRIWEVAEWSANTSIFMLAGFLVGGHFPFQGLNFWEMCGWAMVNWSLLVIIRGIVFAMAFPILQRSGYGMDLKRACVCVWGGLRGAIALAMAVMVEHLSDDQLSSLDRSNVFMYTSTTVIITLVINATLTGPLLSFFDFDKKSASRFKLFQQSFKRIQQFEKEKKRHLQSDSSLYKHASFETIDKQLKLVENIENELFRQTKIAEARLKAEHKAEGKDEAETEEEMMEVAKEQFLTAFLVNLDKFRKDAKMSGFALYLMQETAMIVSDPEQANMYSLVGTTERVHFAKWWEELLLPKILKMVNVISQSRQYRVLNCLGTLPLCGGPFRYWARRHALNQIQAAVEIAKGFDRAVRTTWDVIERSLCDLDEDHHGLHSAMGSLKAETAEMLHDAHRFVFDICGEDAGRFSPFVKELGSVAFAMVETRRAIDRLLHRMEERANLLKEEGVLDHKLHEEIEEMLMHQREAVRHKFTSGYAKLSDEELQELFPLHKVTEKGQEVLVGDGFEFMDRDQTTLRKDADDDDDDHGPQQPRQSILVPKHGGRSRAESIHWRKMDPHLLMRAASQAKIEASVFGEHDEDHHDSAEDEPQEAATADKDATADTAAAAADADAAAYKDTTSGIGPAADKEIPHNTTQTDGGDGGNGVNAPEAFDIETSPKVIEHPGVYT